MRYRLRWSRVGVVLATGFVVAGGLLLAHQALHERAVDVLTSGYGEASNPDVPTEAAWKAMSWEEKRECKQRFWESFTRRLHRSSDLDFLASLALCGVVATTCCAAYLVATTCTNTEATP